MGKNAAAAGLEVTPHTDSKKKFEIEEKCTGGSTSTSSSRRLTTTSTGTTSSTGLSSTGARTTCGTVWEFYAKKAEKCDDVFGDMTVEAPKIGKLDTSTCTSFMSATYAKCKGYEKKCDATALEGSWEETAGVSQFARLQVWKAEEGIWKFASTYAISVRDPWGDVGAAVGGLAAMMGAFIVMVIMNIVTMILWCVACCCMGDPNKQDGQTVVVVDGGAKTTE